MKVADLGIIIPGAEPHMDIQSAIEAASEAPGGIVWIPAHYNKQDSFTNPKQIPIIDCRELGFLYFGAPVTINDIDGGSF